MAGDLELLTGSKGLLQMRKCFVLLCAGLVAGVSSALVSDWTTLELPASGTADYVGAYWGMQSDVDTALSKVSGKDTGIYAGINGGDTPLADGEGVWTVDSGTKRGSISGFGRNGAGGREFAIVLGGLTAGTEITQVSFSASLATQFTSLSASTMRVGLGVWDASAGRYVQTAATEQALTTGDHTYTISDFILTLDNPLTLGEGDKIVVVMGGAAGQPAGSTAFTFSGIEVAYTYTIPDPPVDVDGPEPTALALLAVGIGAVALRRKTR